MTQSMPDDLWRDFFKTATEFEARFATEEDCRAYWIKARWGGKPACAHCSSARVWTIREGTTFECADCGHQTSLTAGTLLEKTHKPLKVWFRAIFEISARRTGISGKDLQRIMGFGSYKTAWSWLHKLRAAMVRSDSEPLGPFVQVDEALVGGRGGPHKELVLVAAEANGRVRLAHVENNDSRGRVLLRSRRCTRASLRRSPHGPAPARPSDATRATSSCRALPSSVLPGRLAWLSSASSRAPRTAA